MDLNRRVVLSHKLCLVRPLVPVFKIQDIGLKTQEQRVLARLIKVWNILAAEFVYHIKKVPAQSSHGRKETVSFFQMEVFSGNISDVLSVYGSFHLPV